LLIVDSRRRHGHEGAASADQDQQAQAVGLFLSDALVQI
jgi:hypothetical protein